MAFLSLGLPSLVSIEEKQIDSFPFPQKVPGTIPVDDFFNFQTRNGNVAEEELAKVSATGSGGFSLLLF